MTVVEYTYHEDRKNSSAISEVWYSSVRRELYVRFKDSGQIAGYSDVSPIAADKLVSAASIGSYYTRYIKPNYKGINTANVEFRAAPGLAKKHTDTINTQPWKGATIKATVTPDVPAPVQPKRRYRVTGEILKPVTHNEVFEAASMEEAIAAFRKKYADKAPDVKGVVTY